MKKNIVLLMLALSVGSLSQAGWLSDWCRGNSSSGISYSQPFFSKYFGICIATGLAIGSASAIDSAEVYYLPCNRDKRACDKTNCFLKRQKKQNELNRYYLIFKNTNYKDKYHKAAIDKLEKTLSTAAPGTRKYNEALGYRGPIMSPGFKRLEGALLVGRVNICKKHQ